MQHILWTYDHPTARDQEMILFKSVGSAVIPVFTGVNFYPGYNDETHEDYPDWRSNVSIPLNCVELIRRNFDLARLTPDIRHLINKYIDVIFINCEPEELQQLLGWYKGKVLLRCNGGPNIGALDWQTSGWVKAIIDCKAAKRVTYMPGHETLFIEKFRDAGIGLQLQNVYVKVGRFRGLSYSPKNTNRISCAISYLEFHDYFREHFENVVEASSKIDLKIDVFGKNKKPQVVGDVEVKGHLEHELMWSSLLSNKVFVDVGQNPMHTIFPPLEAMMLGMPVLFPRNNGHVQSLECSLDLTLGVNEGVFENLNECFQFASEASLEDLEIIHRAQVEIFKNFFSRSNARTAALAAIELSQGADSARTVIFEKSLGRLCSGLFRRIFKDAQPSSIKFKPERASVRRVYLGHVWATTNVLLSQNRVLTLILNLFKLELTLHTEAGGSVKLQTGVNKLPEEFDGSRVKVYGSVVHLLFSIRFDFYDQ